MNRYRVKVEGYGKRVVQAKDRLAAIVNVCNRFGVRYADVKVSAQEIDRNDLLRIGRV